MYVNLKASVTCTLVYTPKLEEKVQKTVPKNARIGGSIFITGP